MSNINDRPKPFVQDFPEARASVIVYKTPLGRVAKVSHYGPDTRKGSYMVPIELCGLAAGPDAWMKKILVKCAGCKERTAAGDLGSGELCPKCVEAAEQENARLDGEGA
jgi:hypothetical protein